MTQEPGIYARGLFILATPQVHYFIEYLISMRVSIMRRAQKSKLVVIAWLCPVNFKQSLSKMAESLPTSVRSQSVNVLLAETTDNLSARDNVVILQLTVRGRPMGFPSSLHPGTTAHRFRRSNPGILLELIRRTYEMVLAWALIEVFDKLPSHALYGKPKPVLCCL